MEEQGEGRFFIVYKDTNQICITFVFSSSSTILQNE